MSESKSVKEVLPTKSFAHHIVDYHVIDVRTKEEREQIGYLPNSIHIPLENVLDASAIVPTGKPLLLVCARGNRSLKAAEALMTRGYEVTNLASGTIGWIDAGFPVEKVDGPKVKEAFPTKELYSRLDSFAVIDVRAPSERDTGFVPGSVNIPIEKIIDGSVQVPDDKPVLTVCGHGMRGLKAAQTLASRGYDATNLVLGTSGWIENGLPIEHTKQ